MMTVVPFERHHIRVFLGLATTEGWVSDAWEFDYLLTSFPQGCWCACSDEGDPAAFVTSVLHASSGWIGNLIVDEQYRGKGLGRSLFSTAFESLRKAGAETVYLTASESGRPLYEQCGFRSIDTIIRWKGFGRRGFEGHNSPPGSGKCPQVICDLDERAWGDRREKLMDAVSSRGEVVCSGEGFLVTQPVGAARQLGPFMAGSDAAAEFLFEETLRSVPSRDEIVIDAPAGNRSALRLYNRRNMRIIGRNELMYAGRRPCYRPEYIYGLATMGSCG